MDAFVVIAKEPLGGSAKTRLRPLLGAEGAGRIAEAMLLDTLHAVAAAAAAAPTRLVLFHDSPGGRPRTCDRPSSSSFELLPQPPGTLGERLDHVTRVLLGEGCDAVVVIAADAPHVAGTAAAVLPSQSGEVVLAPCVDGGYWAVGLDEPAPIFDLPMGGDDVLAATVGCARAAGRPVRLLEPRLDVDTPEDLAALAADGSLARAPRTAAVWQTLVAARPR